MSWDALLLSFGIAICATIIAGIIGILLGWWMSRARGVIKDVVDVAITSPMVLPPTVLGYYLLVLLGRESALGGWYERITGSPIVFSRTGAILAATIGALPLIAKAARSAMESIDPELYAVARTLGATPLRIFLKIALPLARNGLASGLALGFARSLGDFGVTLMVAGDLPGYTQTGAIAIYDAVQANKLDDAAAMAMVMGGTAVVFLFAAIRLGRAQQAVLHSAGRR